MLLGQSMIKKYTCLKTKIITAQLLFLQLFISQFLNCVPSTHNKHRDKHTTNKQVQLRTEHQAKQKHKRAH